MYVSPGIVVGFHGCDRSVFEQAIQQGSHLSVLILLQLISSFLRGDLKSALGIIGKDLKLPRSGFVQRRVQSSGDTELLYKTN